jgi:hypothetical protein
MTNKLKVHKQEKIIISIVYCLSIYFDENIMLAKQMVFFVSTCNNKLSSVMEIIYGTAIRLQLFFFYESWMDHSSAIRRPIISLLFAVKIISTVRRQ